MQLSAHFFLREFLVSQTAARMGQELNPPPEVIENLRSLCAVLLEPIRVLLGRPIAITSGWRPDWLNVAIGGSPTSNHRFGLAADVEVVGMSPPTFARWVEINAIRQRWPIDQCILEFPPNGWVHLGIALGKPRNEFLTAKSAGGKTFYVPGIVG